MEFLGLLWDQGIMRPMINALALLYHYLFLNYGLSIIAFTVIVRVLMIPLTVRQTRQMKKLQALQPRMKAIQDKYRDKKDAESRRAQSSESMALYREAGVNPIGCLGPMVIQMPIWIGFYRAIIRTMPTTPEGMANLSASFYAWNPASADVPLSRLFLGIDLADTVSQVYLPLNFVLPVLVGASMFITTKMTSTIAMDERQQSQQRIMQWMMPVRLHISIPSRAGYLHLAVKHRRRGDSVLRRRPTTDRSVRKALPGHPGDASSSDCSEGRTREQATDRRLGRGGDIR